MEKEWAKYKYWVMSRSQEEYNNLRLMFKGNAPVSEDEFNIVIERLKDTYNNKAELNAFQHVWGYFKKDASKFEKETFLRLVDEFKQDESKCKDVYLNLYELSNKYNKTYLLESYYFDEYIKKD